MILNDDDVNFSIDNVIPISEALDRKSLFTIYPEDLEVNKPLVDHLNKRSLEQISKYTRAPIITAGTEFSQNVLDRLTKAGKGEVVVLLNPTEIEEKRKSAPMVPRLAPYHCANMIAKSYTFIQKKFAEAVTGKEKSLEAMVKRYKSEMGERFSIVSPEWKIIHENFIEGILKDYAKYSLIEIEERLFREHGIKEPYMLKMMYANLLGLRLNANPLELGVKLSKEALEVLSLASSFANIGDVLYSMKIEGPIDAEKEVIEYIKGLGADFFDNPKIIEQIKRDSTFLPSSLRNHLIDFAIKHYRKPAEFNYQKAIHRNIPLYSLILLTDFDGRPVRPLSIDHLCVIYKQGFNEDGTLPDSLSNVMYDPSLKNEIEKIFRVMKTEKTKCTSEELDIMSKILHVITGYLSSLDEARIENIPDPYGAVITRMFKEVDKYGKIFELFFNELVPQKYYPAGLVLRISEDNSLPILKRHSGYYATLVPSERGEGKDLFIYADKNEKKLPPNLQIRKPMDELTKGGHRIFFKINDYNDLKKMVK